MSRMIDVSVSNLIAEMQFGSNAPVPFAVLYPTDNNMPLQALDAGPKFPKVARDYLVRAFEADERGFSSDNAQCRIHDYMLDTFIGWISAQYYHPDIAIIDIDPHPDLCAHLTRPYWGNIRPPLDKFEFNTSITLDLLRFARQPPSLEKSSGDGVNTVNLFIVWNMWVSDKGVFKKLQRCPAITFLDELSLQSTQGGSCLGSYRGKKLSRNIGVENYYPCLK